ncbi:uncharacterized protein LOC116159930 [Photinus pyralis]|uniref:uncharacterized protein LOC116159930 n=1 Tax=Photinus pyralis TaxID=7054 RepID=UPI001266FF36|nr:uncharacterized protein LOC116159930 [Photinus pyralis]
MELDLLLDKWNVVTNENGEVTINGCNIVLQHKQTHEIGYIENTDENQSMLGLSIQNEDTSEADVTEDTTNELQGVSEDSQNDEYWNHEDTQYLLTLYAENIDKFRNTKIKKKDLWKQIGCKIGKSDVLCDRKFRNLKGTYIKLVRKKRKTGEAPIKWPYFSLMQDILNQDVNINPVKYLRPITTISSPSPIINESCVPPSCTSRDKTNTPSVHTTISSITNKSLNVSSLTATKDSTNTPPNSRSQTPSTSTPDGEETNNVRAPTIRKRKFDKYRELAADIKERQTKMESKIDVMNEILMKSNKIQEARNNLLKQYLEQKK